MTFEPKLAAAAAASPHRGRRPRASSSTGERIGLLALPERQQRNSGPVQHRISAACYDPAAMDQMPIGVFMGLFSA